MSRLRALLQLPGTTPEFKKSIHAQMEQIAREMSEPTQAAPQLDTSPCAAPVPAVLLSPAGPARSSSSAESSLAVSPSGGLPGAQLLDTFSDSFGTCLILSWCLYILIFRAGDISQHAIAQSISSKDDILFQ